LNFLVLAFFTFTVISLLYFRESIIETVRLAKLSHYATSHDEESDSAGPSDALRPGWLPWSAVSPWDRLSDTRGGSTVGTAANHIPPDHAGGTSYRFRDDGLVEIEDVHGPHPILELISRSEKDWEGKLKSASRTLEEAVGEYTRRYRRLPPRDFDKW
jgi:hypothetical protein